MIIPRKPLPRRTVLKGLGVSIGLPLLEIMGAKEAIAQENITRVAWVYVPNGWYRLAADFFPSNTGENYTSTRFLAPMQSHKADFIALSNLSNSGGRADGDGPGDHARAAGTYLSATRILKDTNRVDGGQTIDRYISNQTKLLTPIESLVMGLGSNDGGDSGYNNLNKRLSWKSATEPVAWESAEAAFNRLVSGNVPSQVNEQTQIRGNLQKSVLDFVINDDLPRLRSQLGQADREKLDSYLSGLRDVERRIEIAPTQGCSLPNQLNFSGANTSQQVNLMYDVMLAAFECDLTRVAVLSLGQEGNGMRPDGIDIADGWHSTSHYDTDRKKDDYNKIGDWVAERAADLMQKMQDKNMMDSSLVSFGAGTGGDNSQAHGDVNLPTLLIGRGNNAVRPGRHLRLPDSTPIANLWATMANHAGVPVNNNRWGDFGTETIDLS